MASWHGPGHEPPAERTPRWSTFTIITTVLTIALVAAGFAWAWSR